MGRVFTIGHGSRSMEEFLELLSGSGVDMLLDVRRYPGSRRFPHFGRQALFGTLRTAGIEYQWWGETMGGRRKADEASAVRHPAWRVEAFAAYASHMETPEFRRALGELQEMSDRRRAAVMCAEAPWWKCHRRLIADALVSSGAEVVHLGLGKPEAHHLSEWARLDGNGVLVYDVVAPAEGVLTTFRSGEPPPAAMP